jgi:hypothetical protein
VAEQAALEVAISIVEVINDIRARPALHHRNNPHDAVRESARFGGRKAKPPVAYRRRFCRLSSGTQYKISKIKYAVSMIAVTPAMENTRASLASW